MKTPDGNILDGLVREAAGPRPDPGPSRRALRASLAGPLARRERRQARARVARTLALSLLLLVALSGQLGSDDFEVSVRQVSDGTRTITTYRQGLRGTEVRTSSTTPGGGLSRETAEALLMEIDGTKAVPVVLSGFRLGTVDNLHFACQYVLPDGTIARRSIDTRGSKAKTPPEINRWLGADSATRRARARQVMSLAASRAPDFTTPMYEGGLTWVVEGWRMRLPGCDEIIYLSGFRADGLRPLPAD